MQPRATINLAKAKRLIDDRSQLTKKETSARGGGRRKSAFAEEEDGYMFVEEGFRIRFGNGETIDFYAESAANKDDWMKALGDAIGKDGSGSAQRAWTSLVLAKEAQQGRTTQPQNQSQTHTQAPPQDQAQTTANVNNRAARSPTNDVVQESYQKPQEPPYHAVTQETYHPQPTPKQRPLSVPKPLPRKNVPISPAKQNFSQLVPTAEPRYKLETPKSPWHRADRRQQLRAHTRDKVRSMVL